MTHNLKIVGRVPENKGTTPNFRDPLRGMDCELFLDGQPLHAVGLKLELTPGSTLVKAVIEICPSTIDIELDDVIREVIFKEALDPNMRQAKSRQEMIEQVLKANAEEQARRVAEEIEKEEIVRAAAVQAVQLDKAAQLKRFDEEVVGDYLSYTERQATTQYVEDVEDVEDEDTDSDDAGKSDKDTATLTKY